VLRERMAEAHARSTSEIAAKSAATLVPAGSLVRRTGL
jgi:hypothetical protein